VNILKNELFHSAPFESPFGEPANVNSAPEEEMAKFRDVAKAAGLDTLWGDGKIGKRIYFILIFKYF
jgi:hypothetical protein